MRLTLPTGLATALALFLGLEFADVASPTAWALLGTSASLVAIVRPRGFWGLFAALVASSAAGGLRATPAVLSLPPAQDVRIEGRIVRWDPRGDHAVAVIHLVRVEGRVLSPPRPVRLVVDDSWGTRPPSAWVRFRGDVRSERGATNPGPVWTSPHAGTVRARSRPQWGPGTSPRTWRWRADLAERLRDRLPGFSGRLGEAMLLGRGQALHPEERQSFRSSGISHLVAVSGLHVGLIAGLAGLLVFGLPRGPRTVLLVLLIWIYVVLTGCPASAVRAGGLLSAGLLGTALARPRPAWAWLALVMPWLLWAVPGLRFSVGFALSAGAVGGILFATDLLGSRPRILIPLTASLGAQWGTLPGVLGAFGTLPLALAPNLVAVPLAGLFLPSVLLSQLPGDAGKTFATGAHALAGILSRVATLAADHLPSYSGLAPPHPVVAWSFAALVSLWFSLSTRTRRRVAWRVAGAVLASGLAALSLVPPTAPHGPWVAFLDVGQGDAAVFRLSDDSWWVVDVGDDRGPGDGARNAVLPFLRQWGVRSVDGLILSHRHRDHVGGLASLLGAVEVDRVFDAGYGNHEGTAGWVDNLLAMHERWPCLVAAGDTLYGEGESVLSVWSPPRGDLENPPGGNLNNASLVVLLEDPGFSVLWTGDAEREAEAWMGQGQHARRVDVLKVGHHGSSTSTTPAFLDALQPRWAVVSCGEGNHFGHPAPETVIRLEAAGVSWFRTDRDGALWLAPGKGGLATRSFPPRKRGL